MPEIKIFDPARIAEMLARSNAGGSIDEFTFGEQTPEHTRDKYIEKLATDPRRGLRDVLIANNMIVKRLTNLHALCPNFSEAIGIYEFYNDRNRLNGK